MVEVKRIRAPSDIPAEGSYVLVLYGPSAMDREHPRDAELSRCDQPHSVFMRSTLGGFQQRSCAMTKPGGDDESARRAPLSCLIDEAWD